MSICDKYIRVTADQREDGTIGIKANSEPAADMVILNIE